MTFSVARLSSRESGRLGDPQQRMSDSQKESGVKTSQTGAGRELTVLCSVLVSNMLLSRRNISQTAPNYWLPDIIKMLDGTKTESRAQSMGHMVM